MLLAVIAGCLAILGLLRMAQSLGVSKERENRVFNQGMFFLGVGAVVGFVAFFLKIM